MGAVAVGEGMWGSGNTGLLINTGVRNGEAEGGGGSIVKPCDEGGTADGGVRDVVEEEDGACRRAGGLPCDTGWC